MKIPPITKSQKEIIFYLYKFRYLKIEQLQKLFHHKDPKRIKEWLKDLHNKELISVIKNPKDRTKPYIYCLAQKSRHVLKVDEDTNQKFLNWLYKEKSKDENFINKNLFIVDIYLYFHANKVKASELSFFTKQDLADYDYLPDPLPDAYIDVKEEKENTRYFLDFFDSNTPSGVIRYRVKYYLQYFDEGSWQSNTNNTPFPTLLFVLTNERRKKHIDYYAKALLEKTIDNEIEFFLTTKESIKFAKDNVNIWQRVEIE